MGPLCLTYLSQHNKVKPMDGSGAYLCWCSFTSANIFRFFIFWKIGWKRTVNCIVPVFCIFFYCMKDCGQKLYLIVCHVFYFCSKRGFDVRSFGTGSHVKLPGPAPDKPNVYDFKTTYVQMYNDLVRKDKELYPLFTLLHTHTPIHAPVVYFDTDMWTCPKCSWNCELYNKWVSNNGIRPCRCLKCVGGICFVFNSIELPSTGNLIDPSAMEQ